MLLKEVKNIFHLELNALYPKEEVAAFFYRMVEHYLGLERFVLVLRPELTLSKEEEQPLFTGLARLKKEEPLQYILGEAHFLDLTLKVNQHVLIPRPETEELVGWVISEIRNRKSTLGQAQLDKIKILDIGTGSGCIAIALAKQFPKSKVYALDVSQNALEMAQKNAELNKVTIEFIQADILDGDLELEPEFDIVVSNPPYVREQEKQAIKNNVKHYEPRQALFVTDDNPLVFYSAIAEFGKRHLKAGGKLFFEINQYLSSEMQELLANNGYSAIELRKDIFGNFRMLKAVWEDSNIGLRTGIVQQ